MKPSVFPLLMIVLLASSQTLLVLASSYTVDDDVISTATQYNSQRKLARTSDGTLHTVFNKYNGSSNQIYYAYSIDNGLNWICEQISYPQVDYPQYYPSIAVDSMDNIHIVWEGFGWNSYPSRVNLLYRMKSETGWQETEKITDMDDYSYDASIAVDSMDNIHVVWIGTGYGDNTGYYNIQYRMRNTSGWQPRENLTDIECEQFEPAIAIDTHDNIHVVWYGCGWGNNPSSDNIQYKMRTETGWQNQESVTDSSYSQTYPSIAVDSLDNIHVVWEGYGSTHSLNSNIKYRVKTETGWNQLENITDIDADQNYPSIALDSQDNIHVVWHGENWGSNPDANNIQYRLRTDMGWQTQVGLTDQAYNQMYPSCIWAMWPDPPLVRTDVPETGFALVYTSQVDDQVYDLAFYASEDLTWGEKISDIIVGGELTFDMSFIIRILYVILELLLISSPLIFSRRTRY